MFKRKLIPAASVAAASLLILAGCGASGESALGGGSQGSSDTVFVGSADFTESQIIAEIYSAALNKSGIDSQTRPSIGAREAYIGAVEEGSIGVVPDYSGNLLLYLDSQATASTPEDVLSALPAALPQGLQVLDAASAEDKDSLTITRQSAEALNVKSIEDLAPHCSDLTLGAPPEFNERAVGVPGIEAKYGCTFKEFSPINDGGGTLTVEALTSNQIQVANIYTTSPAIAANDLVTLEDPKNNFIAQQVLPLINKDKVPTPAQEVLNKVSARLTTKDLIDLNTRVSGSEKASPQTAAKDWVEANIK